MRSSMPKSVKKNNAGIPSKPWLLSGAVWILIFSLSACSGTAATGLASPTISPIQPVSPNAPTGTPASTATFTATSNPTPVPTISPFLNGFPDTAAYAWTPVVSGLDLPVDIQNAGDGTGRLFIVQKRGSILILQNGQLLPQPFLDITSEVDSNGTEQGLLGLAFHPNYSKNGSFFVTYIDRNGNSVVARFHVSANDPNAADPASEVDIYHINQPYPNHNGGGMAFGADGYLYIGSGDGGSEGDPNRTGQNLQTPLGKILRINVDSGEPATIPPDNPFIGKGGLPEIWAYGLRNPWRFSFDPLTGNLYIGDVGQDAWEEVDFVPAGTPGGMNFGWSYYEGMHPYQEHASSQCGVHLAGDRILTRRRMRGDRGVCISRHCYPGISRYLLLRRLLLGQRVGADRDQPGQMAIQNPVHDQCQDHHFWRGRSR